MGEVPGERPFAIRALFVEEGIFLLQFLDEERVHLLEPNAIIRTDDHLARLDPRGVDAEAAMQRVRSGIGVREKVGSGIRDFSLGVEVGLKLRPLVTEVLLAILGVYLVFVEKDVAHARESGLLERRLLLGKRHGMTEDFSRSLVRARDDAVVSPAFRHDELDLLLVGEEGVKKVAIILDRVFRDVDHVPEQKDHGRPRLLPKRICFPAHERRRLALVTGGDDLVDGFVPPVDGGEIDVNVVPLFHDTIITFFQLKH